MIGKNQKAYKIGGVFGKLVAYCCLAMIFLWILYGGFLITKSIFSIF